MGRKFAHGRPGGLHRRAARVRRLGPAAAGVLLVAVFSGSAAAKKNGHSSQDCSGCHSGSPTPDIELELPGEAMDAGETITLRVTVPGGDVAGLHLWSNPPGDFEIRSGEGLKSTGDGVTHTAPKRASSGRSVFTVDWKPNASYPGVLFSVAAVAANGDDRRQGDRAAFAQGSMAIGCDSGTLHFRDFDADGFGRTGQDNEIRACSPPEGFADNGDDCDDNNENVFPGADEICNERDDDCDGEADEGLPIEVLYEDEDGAGHGRPGSQMKMACGPQRGWGVGGEDCDDDDPEKHPDAEELCNVEDDDCDGRVDEGARATCGEGWCRRTSPSCEADLCRPGSPRDERCNLIDDDCDGETDEGDDLCEGEGRCVDGACEGGDDDGAGGRGGQGDDDDDDDDDDDRDDDDDDSDDEAGSQRGSGGCRMARGAPACGALGWLLIAGLLIRRRRRAR